MTLGRREGVRTQIMTGSVVTGDSAEPWLSSAPGLQQYLLAIRTTKRFPAAVAVLLDRFEQVSELQLFGAQVEFCGIGRFDFNGDAFDNVQPGLFHGKQLQWIIG